MSELREAVKDLLAVLDREALIKGAVASHETAKAPEDTTWDGAAARKRLAEWASSDSSGDKDTIDWPKYRTGFAWYDGDEPELTGSYKLPHHDIVDGEFKVVWNGVSAAGAACQGSRGGVDIPEDDMDAVKAHLETHFAQFDKVPSWKQEKSAPVGKVGRVLSAKNENALRAAVDAAEQAIAAVRLVLDQLGESEQVKGRDELRPIFKMEEDGKWSVFAPILKVDSARHVVTSHALAANVVDYQDDYIEPDQIWKAMEKYMIAFQQVGVMHQEINPLLHVVECYQAPVPFELGGQPVAAGDWLMSVKVLDEDVWTQVESGDLRGFSIGGRGLRIPVEELPEEVQVLAE
jgi:hypothetical protein